MRRLFKWLLRRITAPFRWLWKVFLAFLNLTPFRDFLVEEPEDTPILDTVQKAGQEPKEFLFALLEHLNELRKHLLNSLIVLLITSGLSFYYISDILHWLTMPVGGIEKLQATEVTEPVSVVMRVALTGGFAIAIPYISFELLRFIAPGISKKARAISLMAIPFVSVFFIAGMLFAYYFMLPVAIKVMLNFGGFTTIARPDSYFRTVGGIMFWIGIAFEFPLVSFLLSAMRILSPKMLKDNWRMALILLSIFAAMITPTTDPINMMIVLIPLMVLYGLGIIMAQLGRPKKA
ncbi:MAG: twin-arginine translocase subunit TatC [Anaerolineae bacterium]|nr:twin-arginine translocase subunit TatC [Anaerolineae bacterium]